MTNNLVQHDQQQRAQALLPNQSFIVQAPAGSGKTELIIQRFLTLLGQVKKPEEILAITFTKKAAHEMRARVLKALDHALYQPEPEKAHEKLTWQIASAVLRRDRELGWNLISNPNQLQIKTIDSFCSFLTGQLPLLAHFGSQPDITTQPSSLYREAVLEVLTHVEEDHPWSPAVAHLLSHLDNDIDRLKDLLTDILGKRDQWQRHVFYLDEADIREFLTANIAAIVSEKLEMVRQIFPENIAPEVLALARYAADYASHSGKNLAVVKLLDITELPDSDADSLQQWQALAEFLLTGDNEWRKQAHKNIGFPVLGELEKSEKEFHRSKTAEFKDVMGRLADQDALLAALKDVRLLPPADYTDAQWQTLQALLEVLKITLAQLRVTFQLHGKIDFIENAVGAAHALGDEQQPTDLALALDYQIKHILIDEFQDTSISQYHLLKMLTHGWTANDGRTLFIVGDPMQSIYRFRQAEVGLFISLQQGMLGELKLTPLTLHVNFRSTENIVNWNNQQFTAIFPAYSDIGSGAVHFSPSIANTSHNSNTSDSAISIQGYIGANAATQAQEVVRFIQQTLQHAPNEKIAILTRTRGHLAEIIPALKSAGLRFNALEIDPLETRQCIQDLLALTRALIHPADRIAWLAILRAPWCGLTLADLLQVAGKNRHEIIWDRLHHPDVISTLSADGQQRLATIMPALRSAIENRQRRALRQWIELTWQALGGPATLTEQGEMADTDEFFSLLDELTSHAPVLSVDELTQRIEQLYASTHYDDAPIQIMTIHAAKGLEFDTVILPHLERGSSKDDKYLLHWMQQTMKSGDEALLLAPINSADSDKDLLHSYIQKMQQVKAEYEVNRLFYVAATRAKKRLHLVFSFSKDDCRSPADSFAQKLWPQIKNSTQLVNLLQDNKTSDEQRILPPRKINRLISEWQHPASVNIPQQHSSYQNKNGFQLRDPRSRLHGTIAHLFFQQLSLHGTSWWNDQSQQTRTQQIKRELMRAGYPAAEISDGCKVIENVIEQALQDERGRWILASHKDAQSEFKLSAVIDNKPESLIIDRTFVDEHGVRWIIDYKTAEFDGQDLAVFLREQQKKYAPQMMKYQQAIQHMDTRPIKLGLYFPAIPAWQEWTTDS